MPFIDAQNFIKEIAPNNEMRRSLYEFENARAIKEHIETLGFNFKLYEFEQSILYLKTEAPNEEQAIMLDELLLWWNMLMYDGSITEEVDSSECSPVKCGTCSSCG